MNRGHSILAAILALLMLAVSADGQDITTGLTGHWRLVETSGTTAVDSSASPNHGAYKNGVILANSSPVPVDGAIAPRFDGVDDYVEVPNESNFDYTGAMSAAIWVKVNSFTTDSQALFTKGDNAWKLTRDGTNSGLAFSCGGLTTARVASSVAVNDGKWHHVVGVYTGSHLRIYIDGVLSNSVSSIGFITQNNSLVNIGRNAVAGGREFNGWLYDARIYNRALSAADASYLYLQGGPVGHWTLSETSGTTAVDSSLYARNGSVSGGASWSNRCGGTGTFDFNGSGHYISIANAAQLQPTSALTIAGWIRGDSWSSADVVNAILRKGENNPNNYQLSVANGRLSLALDANDPPVIQGNTLLETGRWYHVAATWDGSTAKLYLNGQLDNTTARSGTIGTDTRALYIGGRSGTDFFDGMLYDVRLYNRALSAVDVAKLAGLIGHWKFAEGSGATAADSSTLANNATLSGGAGWTTDCAANNALQTNGAGGIAITSPNFTPPSTGTVAFWMQGAGTPATQGRVFGVNDQWEVRQEPNGTLSFDFGGSPYVGNEPFSTLTAVDTAGRWYHIVAVFNDVDNSFAVYVDGELRTSGISPVDLVPQPQGILSFGTRTGSTEYWLGALRDFRVYNRRLCPGEIAELYGLVGHWKLDETSGTMAADSSGLGRDGAVIGTAAWTTGAINNGLQLDGATHVQANGLMGKPSHVTLSAWAYLTAADSGGAEIVSLGDYFAIRLNQGAPPYALFYNGSTWVSVAMTQTVGNGWHHYAAVFDDNQNFCKLYVDGEEEASVATAVTIPYTGMGTNTIIGRHGNGTTTFDFTGIVDDVRVYNRALCPTEIRALRDGGQPFEGVRIIKWVEIQ